jgi:hypothetical protein
MDAYFRGFVQVLSHDERVSAEAPEAAEPSPPPGPAAPAPSPRSARAPRRHPKRARLS